MTLHPVGLGGVADPIAAISKRWLYFTLRCRSLVSRSNVNAAWLNASQKSRGSLGMNRSASVCSVKLD